MLRAWIIIGLVVASLIGGLLALRSSRNAGMPDTEVLERAKKRAAELAAAERGHGGSDGGSNGG